MLRSCGRTKEIGKGHYFISDAHISNNDWHNTNLLLSFFESISNKAKSLFILGDLFELCFRYRQRIPETNRQILKRLKELRATGIPVYYLLGNHDYWVRDFVKNDDELSEFLPTEQTNESDDGILAKTFQIANLDGKKAYVGHGDEIDHSILTVLSRTILRSQSNPFVYCLLHPKLGLAYARWIESVARNLADSMGVVGKFESFAQKKIVREGYDIVILGHTHKPRFQKIGAGYYLNTGNWIDDYNYVVIEDSQPRLEKFKP
ncbi:MAG: UDP-2,3-diacylglucosamine diphosphatase [candidate division WOR-3 bacterium]